MSWDSLKACLDVCLRYRVLRVKLQVSIERKESLLGLAHLAQTVESMFFPGMNMVSRYSNLLLTVYSLPLWPGPAALRPAKPPLAIASQTLPAS